MKTISHPLLSVAAALALTACSGDDSATTATSSTSATGSTSVSASSDTTASTNPTDPTSSTTDASGSNSDTATGSSTTDATTTTTTGETTGVTATDPTTTDPTTTDPTTTGDPVCGNGIQEGDELCDPSGTPSGACFDAGAIEVCNGTCDGWDAESCGMNAGCMDGECIENFCMPGAKTCEDENTVVTCAMDGQSFGDPVECAAGETCSAGECVSACELIKNDPSSIGCSFIGNRMDNFNAGTPDSLIVGNPSTSLTANVQFYFTPTNSNTEQAVGAPVAVNPGATHSFSMTNAPPNKVSIKRQGGSYRVQSDIPIIAYQHSPVGQQFTNDASMLLPEHAMRSNHVVASYRASVGNYPSYMNVIALEDGTKVDWTPKVNTAAGSGVAAVNAGQTGTVTLNRFDLLQVRVSNQNQDMSGTYVTGNGKPIWVVGATECANVPASVTYCDHIEEQVFPLDYWGKEYVGAHSPDRNNEKHYWRIFAGDDDVQITTTPAQPGTPFTLAKLGDYQDITVANNTSFMINTGNDKPFLAVQYLSGTSDGAGTGDPSMYQMVPTEQFLSSYAFVTGTNYPDHYAQIIRAAGGSDVSIDGNVVGGYYTVGNFEVSDVDIGEGSHFATSDAPFGIVSIGYSNATSYAYPGGLRFKVINPQ